MAYCGYITTLKNVRPHPNADRLVLGTCFSNTVCVAKDKYYEGQLGVYFPEGGQLSMEFCEVNGLVAIYVNGVNTTGGYMDAEKRNVKAIKLRGEVSDGLFLPLECFSYTGVDITTFHVGDTITAVNGHEICCKYIPRINTPRTSAGGAGKRVKRRAKHSIAPQFFEHLDTEQLQYHLDVFKPGDEVEISLKMHGTSGRTAHVKVLKGMKRNLLDCILGREGKPMYDWGYVSGTRRTVLTNYDGGYYGDDSFREKWHKFFEGKLWKGETIYYEIVGFIDNGKPIMSDGNNAKVNDKDFVKKYGNTTTFSYGCHPGHLDGKVLDKEVIDNEAVVYPQNDIYVYRMTMTNEDGEVVEYTPDFMRYRCELMGVKCVPVFWRGIIPENPGSYEDPTITAGEWIKNVAERFYDGPDPIDKTHIREGVVVRVTNRPRFTAYKHKNDMFKIISGIIVNSIADSGEAISNDVLEEL